MSSEGGEVHFFQVEDVVHFVVFQDLGGEFIIPGTCIKIGDQGTQGFFGKNHPCSGGREISCVRHYMLKRRIKYFHGSEIDVHAPPLSPTSISGTHDAWGVSLQNHYAIQQYS